MEKDPLKVYGERLIGQGMATKEKLDEKNFYYFNPEFDKQML